MMPLCIVLYAGLHGWEEGFVAEGYRCVGFDIVDMCALLSHPRPANCHLVLQDVLTLHGSQFKEAAVIVASPPCQAYSYRAMPWSRAKALPPPDNSLFDACFRIQREASEAAGRHIPLIVENVRGAQKWVGQANWHFGSYYLWGDVPALMPMTFAAEKDFVKLSGDDWNDFRRNGQVSPHWRMQATKGSGGSWFTPGKGTREEVGHWKKSGCVTRCYNSKDIRRKAASAMIAKIPFPLAQHIARCFKPVEWRR